MASLAACGASRCKERARPYTLPSGCPLRLPDTENGQSIAAPPAVSIRCPMDIQCYQFLVTNYTLLYDTPFKPVASTIATAHYMMLPRAKPCSLARCSLWLPNTRNGQSLTLAPLATAEASRYTRKGTALQLSPLPSVGLTTYNVTKFW